MKTNKLEFFPIPITRVCILLLAISTLFACSSKGGGGSSSGDGTIELACESIIKHDNFGGLILQALLIMSPDDEDFKICAEFPEGAEEINKTTCERFVGTKLQECPKGHANSCTIDMDVFGETGEFQFYTYDSGLYNNVGCDYIQLIIKDLLSNY